MGQNSSIGIELPTSFSAYVYGMMKPPEMRDVLEMLSWKLSLKLSIVTESEQIHVEDRTEIIFLKTGLRQNQKWH